VDYLRVLISALIGARGENGMLDSIRARVASEEGQTLVEYTLIVSLIAVICVAALSVTGNSVSDIIDKIAGTV
jgi:pilus assembly protein Flp/PilA